MRACAIEMYLHMSRKQFCLREFSNKMLQTSWIPRPRPTLCASLRGRNALGDFTRATADGNLQVKCRRPEPRHRLIPTLRSQNALGRFTRSILCGNLQVKCHGPEPRPTLSASLCRRNALGDFTRATLYGNSPVKCCYQDGDPYLVRACAVEMHLEISQEQLDMEIRR